MGTFHQRNASSEPTILVGWVAGLLEPWPEETTEEVAVPRPASAPSPEAVLNALAAADGRDRVTYRRRHAADAGAVLALSHHSLAAILAGALQVDGDLTPSAVLDVLHGRAARADRAGMAHRGQLVDLLAS